MGLITALNTHGGLVSAYSSDAADREEDDRYGETPRDIAPVPDERYVNVSLQIDPSWPHFQRFSEPGPGGTLPEQLRYSKLVMVFSTLGDDGLTESAGVNYATSDVLGRAEQYMTHTGNANREIQMTFHFVAQSGEDRYSFPPQQGLYTGTGGPLPEVVYPARWLDSLKYAMTDPKSGITFAPPPLILVVGQLLVARVVVTAADPHWMPPFEPGTMLPYQAEVQVTFSVVRNALSNEDPYARLGELAAADPFNRFVTLPTQGPMDTHGA